MTLGPVSAILNAQDKEGYWMKPGSGYAPKYRGTVWQIIFLSQLGADGSDARVGQGCEYVLEHSRSHYGGFSMNAKPTGLIHCLQGNLVAALIDLGWLKDVRLQEALDWLARSVTGKGIAAAEERKASVRFYRSGNSGPRFLCSANAHLPCAWGAVKAMLAMGKVPEASRTPAIREAINVGLEFLLEGNPAVADYPMGYATKPSRSWFRFGFPIGYVTDVLQNLEALAALGCGSDSRFASALDLMLSKQDSQGRWTLEYTYNGKTWWDIEKRNRPSKWVTLRALRVLKRISVDAARL
jgi:hypothetical protein